MSDTHSLRNPCAHQDPLGEFDEDATRITGEAFDAACGRLNDAGLPCRVSSREIIAKRIIDAAKTGERDPIRLCDLALAALR